MKILVLGNGFDVDHNLPTSYADFLKFCDCVLNMHLYPENECFSQISGAQKNYIKTLAMDKNLKNQFLKLLQKNTLFTYFNNRKRQNKEKWIDLEREISVIVSEFRALEDDFKSTKSTVLKIDTQHRVAQLLKDLDLRLGNVTTWTERQFSIVHTTLCKHIEDFSKALELYISTFINTTNVEGVSPDIIDFNANRILSFNYSNTYERVYGGLRWNEDVEYIHGQADRHLEEYSRIVLGITSEGNEDKSHYVEFEKYYQRITKRTGNNYKLWLQTRVAEDQKIEVMFFGHSLDASDSDIIKDLICDEKTVVKIVYHSQKAYQEIVANLIDIIGKNKLITYVSGESPKITFVQQKSHDNSNTAGVEISRDIQALFRLYLMSEQRIQELFEKITQKIKTKDISYFYSQRKVISLFDAMGYHIENSSYAKELLEICSAIEMERKYGVVRPFATHEWNNYTPWGEEIPCPDKTEVFIGAVNDTNRSRVEEENGKKKYAHFSKIGTPEQMKEALLEILQEDNPTEEYWNQMNELVELLAESEILEKAFELIKSERLSISENAKFIHLKEVYDEHCFHVYMWREVEKETEERENNFYTDC